MSGAETQPGSRAIFFTEIEQFGGAERSALALARWLYERGLPVHVVAYEDRCGLARYAAHPLQVVELKPARRRISALHAYFASLPRDAPKPLVSGYQPALHATLGRVRGFHTLMHDTPSLFVDANAGALARMRMRVTNRIVAHGLRGGGATIVTSEYLRAECRRDFGVEAQIARMGGMASAKEFRVRAVAPGEPLRMLSACRIEGNKRIDWMLRALAAMEAEPAEKIDWRLDLAGKGPLVGELTALTESLGIAGRVHFHGFVPDDRLRQMYEQAHVFLMPAVQGYGIPAIEALQRGIPVLLHRESGVSDILLETPWATVLTGGEETMLPALTRAVDGVVRGRHRGVPLPALPTEDGWAERVARLCGWVAG